MEETREARDGHRYTQAQFQDFYGDDWVWDARVDTSDAPQLVVQSDVVVVPPQLAVQFVQFDIAVVSSATRCSVSQPVDVSAPFSCGKCQCLVHRFAALGFRDSSTTELSRSNYIEEEIPASSSSLDATNQFCKIGLKRSGYPKSDEYEDTASSTTGSLDTHCRCPHQVSSVEELESVAFLD